MNFDIRPKLCLPVLSLHWFRNVKVIIEIVSLQILNNSVLFVTKTPVIDAPTIFPLWKSDRSDILTYLNVDICKKTKQKQQLKKYKVQGIHNACEQIDIDENSFEFVIFANRKK